MIKIFHTADIHLGAKFGWLNNKSSDFRKKLLQSFENVVNKTIEHKCNIFILAGDLFDTPYPNKTTIAFVQNQIQKLNNNRIYSILIPGNHDYSEDNLIYKKLKFDNPFNFVFLENKPQGFHINEFNLTIYSSGKFDKSDIPEFQKKINVDNSNKKILVLHSGFDIGQNDKSVLTKEDIESLQCDYIALGDWHGTLDVSTKETKAWYPGSIEPLAIDQKNSGNALIIDISEETKIEEIKISSTIIHKQIININQISNTNLTSETILTRILNSINDNPIGTYIKIIELQGSIPFDIDINIENLREVLTEKYYFLKIIDKTTVNYSEEQLSKYPPELLIGRYIKEIKDEIEEETDVIKIQLLEQTLQEGVKRLTEK